MSKNVPSNPDTDISVTMNSVKLLSVQDSLRTALIWQKKCLKRLGMQRIRLNIIKIVYSMSIANMNLNGE